MNPPKKHRQTAERLIKSIGAGVITVSDTRKKSDDISGRVVREKLTSNGVKVVRYTIVRDEVSEIQDALQDMLGNKEIDIIILTGGTGITKRDVTPEAVYPYLEKVVDGFGELFRALSFKDVGPSSILSRAFAGVTKNQVMVFGLPGSPNAVTLALDQIILPELKHIVSMVKH